MAAVMIPLAFVADTIILPILFALLSLRASYEILRCTGLLKSWRISIPTMLFCACGPVLAGIFEADFFIRLTFSFILLYLLLLAIEYTICAAKDDSTLSAGHSQLSGICITAFFCIYVYGGFSSLVLLNSGKGLFWLVLVFVISYMTDTFAYFSGMLFGKHKLIPRVSPKKTIEGSVGGTVMAVVFSLVWYFVYNAIFDNAVTDHIPVILVLALFGSLASQLGDLLMSALKRSFGVKDFGRILPGHGGILDRFDSVLAVSVILYACVNLITLFTK